MRRVALAIVVAAGCSEPPVTCERWVWLGPCEPDPTFGICDDPFYKKRFLACTEVNGLSDEEKASFEAACRSGVGLTPIDPSGVTLVAEYAGTVGTSCWNRGAQGIASCTASGKSWSETTWAMPAEPAPSWCGLRGGTFSAR